MPQEPRPVEFIERRPAPKRWAFLSGGRGALWVAAAVVCAGIAAAAISWQQDVTIDSASQDTDIVFSDGGGGLTGFATTTITGSGSKATLALTGVAGAAMQVTDLLTVTNTDVTQDYSVTLSRSAAPNGAVTKLEFVVKDGATTVETYDAAQAATGTAFTMNASDSFDITVNMDIADGTTAGSLGSFTLEYTIVPI